MGESHGSGAPREKVELSHKSGEEQCSETVWLKGSRKLEQEL